MESPNNPAAVPPLFRRHARRPRLTRLLDQSTAPTILITAPPGYGKTTLAAEWLQGKSKVAWYRASPSSADLAAFSAGVAEVVAPIVPGAGERLRQRLRVGEAPEKAVRPLAEVLAEDLAEWPNDAWLVVDDYHLVADSTPVEEFVDWLLTLAPLRILVTTRRRPAWASARRILYGEITEIGPDQLAMTNEEAGRVLDGRSSEAVRVLVAQAQGWPALIGLAALTASAELPTARVSEALFRYFAEEVLRREPPKVQRFMLMASVPASVSGQIARDILDFPSPEPLLQRLTDEGLLHESGGGDLRFHPLLRDFLRRKLKSDDPDLHAALSEKAMACARSAGRWEEAFELALQIGRLDTAADITGEAAPDLLAAGRVETIEKWLSACGAVAVHQPAPLLAKAEVLIRQGRLSEAAALAQDLAQRLPPANVHASRAWYLAGQAFHLISQERQAFECHLKAKETAKSAAELKRSLWGAILTGGELELDATEVYLDELDALASRDLDGRLLVTVGRQHLASHRGTFAGIWKLYEPLVPLSQYASDPMVRSNFLAGAGYINVARAHYALAHTLTSQAVNFCTDLRLTFAIGVCLFYRASAEIGLRQFTKAQRSMNELSTIDTFHEDPWLQLAKATAAVKLALAQGDFAAALDNFGELAEGEAPRALRGEYWALLAIASAAMNDVRRAREQARLARQLTRAVEGLYYSRFADLLAAMVDREPADRVLGEALNLLHDAARDEFLDALVIAYRAHPPLLSLISRDPTALDLVRRITGLANDHRLALKAGIHITPSEREPLLRSILTRREVEVLRLMSEGLSNAEIAKRLFISTSTAKVHVHHVLEKLGAKTRLQAVLDSKELFTDFT